MADSKVEIVVAVKDQAGNALKQISAEAKNFTRSVNESNSSGINLSGTLGKVGIAAAAAFVAHQVYEFSKALLDANIKAQGLQSSFKAITGSAAGSAKELAFVRQESSRLGLEFYATAEAYKNIAAAGLLSGMSFKNVQDIFVGTVTASKAMNLSMDQTKGVLLAFSQMISKTRISAEEMNQVGERFPAIWAIFSEATGKSTAELRKMMEAGEILAKDVLPKAGQIMKDKFGKDAVDAAQGAQSAVDRLSTAWTDLKVVMGDSGFIDLITAALNKAAGALDSAAKSAKNAQAEMAATANAAFPREKYSSKEEIQARIDFIKGRAIPAIGESVAMRQKYGYGLFGKSRTEDYAKTEQQLNAYEAEITKLNGLLAEFNVEAAKAGSAEWQQSIMNRSVIGDPSKSQSKEIATALDQIKEKTLSSALNTYEGKRRLLDKEIADIKAKDGYLLASAAVKKQIDDQLVEYRKAALAKIAQEEGKAGASSAKKHETELNRMAEAQEKWAIRMEEINRDELGKRLAVIEREKQEFIRAGLDKAQAAQLAELQISEAQLTYSKDASDGVKRAVRDYTEDLADQNQRAYEAVTQTFRGLEDALVEVFTTGKISATSFFNTILQGIARIAAQRITGPLAQAGGGILDSAIKWLMGSGGSGTSMSGLNIVNPSGAAIGWARGGVPGSDLSDYRNSIITRPTVFGFARGMGIMGEAGDEGIFPLRRMSSGNLGVEGTAGGVTVNIIDQRSGGAPVQSRESKGPDGKKQIDILIADAVTRGFGSGQFDRAMQANYGISRQGVNR